MAVQAALRLQHRGCVSERIHGATSLLQISGERGNDLFVLHAPDEAALAKALEMCEAEVGGRKAEVVSRSPTSMVFRGVNPQVGAIASIRDSRCSILWPVVYRDGHEHYHLVAPDRDALRALLEGLRRLGQVHLDRVSDVAPDDLDAAVPLADLTAGLTRRQLDVLLAAVDRGFYDSPRRTSTQALADAFGVAPSTLKEHLRKSERRVLERFSALLRTHPELVHAARRRPGRQRDP